MAKSMGTRTFLLIAFVLASAPVFSQSGGEPRATAQISTAPAVDLKKLSRDGWSTEELIKAAEQGDFAATMELARFWSLINESGEHVSPETLEARHWSRYWLKKATASDHPAPKLYLEAADLSDDVIDDTDSLPLKFKTLVAECNKLALEGDMEAIEALSLFLPLPSDDVINKWYEPIRKKAGEGNLHAKATLAEALIFGHATNESFLKEGLKYAKEAAEEGSPSGMKTYGQALVLDLSDTGEAHKGLEWLNKAADLGHIDAMQVLLMTMHNESDAAGPGEVDQISKREAELVKMLCDRGQLNILVSEGMRLIESGEAPQEGLRMLDRAANMGSFIALDALAKYYQDNGYYVPSNLEKAVGYAQRLADMNAATGILRLAGYYERGQGVKKDETKAYELVLKARELGLANAIVEQARMILQGKGTGAPAAPKEAFAMVKKLSEEIDPPTSLYFLLGYMYESGLGTSIDYNAAFEQYTRGAEAGDTRSMNNLASMYETGLGTEKDVQQALKWYAEAARLGNEDAAANHTRLKEVAASGTAK